jgi:hypothetical protein
MRCYQRIVRDQHEDGHPRPKDFSTASVREIPYLLAKDFILKYEWLGNMGTTARAFGLFFAEELAAVECFGHPGAEAIKNICGKENADAVYWLARGANAHWAHAHSSSYLINAACRKFSKPWKTREGREMPPKFVFCATADSDAGEIGTVYQAAGWHYVGRTTTDRMFLKPGEPPERAKSYRNLVKAVLRDRAGLGTKPDSDGRHYLLIAGKKYYRGDTLPSGELIAGSDKYPFRLRPEYGTTMKEAEAARLREVLAAGYVEVKGNAKHLYVGVYGDRRMQRKLRAALTKKVLPYPKRERDAAQVDGDAVGTFNEARVDP